MSEDIDIHDHITRLVDREHELRAGLGRGEISIEAEHEELARVQTDLDRLWDLLRQRQARRDAGQDPDAARERSAAEVEGYRS